jgi:hypothetical protein
MARRVGLPLSSRNKPKRLMGSPDRHLGDEPSLDGAATVTGTSF